MRKTARIIQLIAAIVVGCVYLEATAGTLAMFSYGKIGVVPPASYFLYWCIFIIPLTIFGYKQYGFNRPARNRYRVEK